MYTMTVLFITEQGVTSQVYTSDYLYKLEERKKKLKKDMGDTVTLLFSIF